MTTNEEKKGHIKLNVIVAIVAFVFSALGAVAGQSFLAGKYANTVEMTATKVSHIEQDFKEHKVYDDQTYLKKEVFNQFKEQRDEFNRQVLDKLNKIEDMLNGKYK